MIDLKQAVTLAVECFEEVSEQDGIVFEEVELEQNGGSAHWLVTVSMPAPGSTGLAAMVGTKSRNYKVVRIDAETGSVESIKIRQL